MSKDELVKPNEDVKSSFTTREKEMIVLDGYAASKAKKKRTSCPFSMQEAIELWLHGWMRHKRDRRNELARKRYKKKKLKEMRELNKQAGKERDDTKK